ncbi:terminase small subunit [Sulfitobacter sp. NAS-14.1]|uniref:terminase small subunit n=1 Tax=Sulfitobacter TaxID=60136 RepID=UPI0003257669|nr:terminase small subunit [Sulfitobacter sp. NAS-14.1]
MPIKWGFAGFYLPCAISAWQALVPTWADGKGMTTKDKIEIRSPPWRPRKFTCPEQLAKQFLSYVDYIEDNPLVLPNALRSEGGGVIQVELRRPRPMTIESFSIFLGISPRTWRYWRANREDLAGMIEVIEGVIFDQLFCLAAADMLKANLISRKLGLTRR